jgi:hypothetical protein
MPASAGSDPQRSRSGIVHNNLLLFLEKFVKSAGSRWLAEYPEIRVKFGCADRQNRGRSNTMSRILRLGSCPKVNRRCDA